MLCGFERHNALSSRCKNFKIQILNFIACKEVSPVSQSSWSGPDVLDFTSQLNDFSDTAALMDNLDLVLAVDTSTAHLAEALGKPVWILNRFDTCWRWLLDRTDRRLVARRYLNRADNSGLGFKRWFARKQRRTN